MTFSVQSEKSCSDHLLSIFWQKQKYILLDCISWSLPQNIPSSQIPLLNIIGNHPQYPLAILTSMPEKNLKGHYNIHTLLEKTSPNSSSQFSLTWHYKLLISHLHWHLFQCTCGNRSQQSPSHSLLFPAQQLELWDFPFPESKARKYFSTISSYCYFRNILMARVPFWDISFYISVLKYLTLWKLILNTIQTQILD